MVSRNHYSLYNSFCYRYLQGQCQCNGSLFKKKICRDREKHTHYYKVLIQALSPHTHIIYLHKDKFDALMYNWSNSAYSLYFIAFSYILFLFVRIIYSRLFIKTYWRYMKLYIIGFIYCIDFIVMTFFSSFNIIHSCVAHIKIALLFCFMMWLIENNVIRFSSIHD